ncbi:MAG: hypothetical protein J6A21_09395 [Lentisphaeria bacterium]|nr:hypothetical protein [Lentisphaeria bacterium]
MDKRRKRLFLSVGALILLFAVLLLGICHPAGSWFFPAIVPDATENALAAWDFVHNGRCGFFLNGVWHPARYSPVLSVTFFAPWIFLFSGEMTAGVYGCFAALGILFLAFAGIGKLLKSFPAVLLSLPLLLLLPNFVVLCNSAMTEIPYTALLALLLFLLLKTAEKEELSASLLLCSGVTAAWAGGIRSTGFFLLLPFLLLLFLRGRNWKERTGKGLLLLLPSLLTLCGILFYNFKVFGSPLRSGYHYWFPVPYDFPFLTFSYAYARDNFRVLLSPGQLLPFLFFLAGSLLYFHFARRKKEEELFLHLWKWGFFFILLHHAILLGLYLFHYCCFDRFFLPSSALEIFGGSLAFWRMVKLFSPLRNRKKILVCFSLAALLFAGGVTKLKTPLPLLVTYAEAMILTLCGEVLPEDAVVITSFNPALSAFLLGKGRKILPVSRRLEYAGKAVSREFIGNASAFAESPPEFPTDHLAALRAYPEKKVFPALPQVLIECLPGKPGGKEERWVLDRELLRKNKVFITNMAVYQIPEEFRERFLKETKLLKTAENGPVQLFRVLPAESGTFL